MEMDGFQSAARRNVAKQGGGDANTRVGGSSFLSCAMLLWEATRRQKEGKRSIHNNSVIGVVLFGKNEKKTERKENSNTTVLTVLFACPRAVQRAF